MKERERRNMWMSGLLAAAAAASSLEVARSGAQQPQFLTRAPIPEFTFIIHNSRREGLPRKRCDNYVQYI